MPDTFGPYQVEEVVARGSTGTVYRTRHVELDREAAVKELSEEVRDVPGQIDRLRAEASILASMSHPHVVEVYDYVEDEAGAWIAEQWIDGGPIQTILDAHGTLEPEQALGVVRGAILGLAHAHDRDIVHRDISTSNILADMEGTSMLVDFGIAAPAGSGHALGTPAFLSPEAAAGLPVGKASDVYSVAAVLYLLLTGSPVFGGTVAQTVEGHLHGTAPALTGHGRQLADLMRRSLSKSPDDRPADAAAFLAELETAAAARYGPEWLAGSSIAGLTGVFGPGRSVLAVIGNAVGLGTGSAVSVGTVAAAVMATVVLVAGAVGAVVLTGDDDGSPSASSTSSASPSPSRPSTAPGAPGPVDADDPTDPADGPAGPDPDPGVVTPPAAAGPSADSSDPDEAAESDGDGEVADGPRADVPVPAPVPDPAPDLDPVPVPDDSAAIALNQARLNGTWTYVDEITETTIPSNLGTSVTLQNEVTATCHTVAVCVGTRGDPERPEIGWQDGELQMTPSRLDFAGPTFPGCAVVGTTSTTEALAMQPVEGSGGSSTVVGTTYTGTWTFTYETRFREPCPAYGGPEVETHSVTYTKTS